MLKSAGIIKKASSRFDHLIHGAEDEESKDLILKASEYLATQESNKEMVTGQNTSR